MIRLTARREVRFSIVVIFFGIFLLISTFFFPWISLKESVNGEQEFHLNLEMMRNSSYPEINNIANKLNVINIILWLTIIIGLLSLLSVSYHSAARNSQIGFYLMILSNIFIIIISFLVVFLYFSVIFYISNLEMILLSSPFAYFSYPFISLIGSVVLLIISVMYGGFITILLLKHFKELKKDEKEEEIFSLSGEPSDKKHLGLKKLRSNDVSGLYNISEKNDRLPAFSIKDSEELEEGVLKEEKETMSESFSFEKTQEEDWEDEDEFINKKAKKTPKPFSFDKSKQIIQDEEKEEKSSNGFEERRAEPFSFDKIKNKKYNKDETKKIKNLDTTKEFDKDRISKPQPEVETIESEKEIIQDNFQIDINLDKKTKFTIRCPQCKHIFSVEKSGDVTSVKCPMCSKEGIIK